MIYDDYAHHPGELHVLLDTAKTLGYERVICAFQPHTYTRSQSAVQRLCPGAQAPRHHPAGGDLCRPGEKNTVGISSRDIAECIPAHLLPHPWPM